MALEKVDKIWMNGKFVNWDDAKIHVLSHVANISYIFVIIYKCIQPFCIYNVYIYMKQTKKQLEKELYALMIKRSKTPKGNAAWSRLKFEIEKKQFILDEL